MSVILTGQAANVPRLSRVGVVEHLDIVPELGDRIEDLLPLNAMTTCPLAEIVPVLPMGDINISPGLAPEHQTGPSHREGALEQIVSSVQRSIAKNPCSHGRGNSVRPGAD